MSEIKICPAEKQDALQLIKQWDLSRVEEKLAKESELSASELEEALTEFRRFMMIRLVTGKPLAMMSYAVDVVWHQFILFTRDYAEFCQKSMGGFVHHNPATSAQPVKIEFKENFIEAYRNLFGDLPGIWNIDASAHGHCSACDGCGAGCGDCWDE